MKESTQVGGDYEQEKHNNWLYNYIFFIKTYVLVELYYWFYKAVYHIFVSYVNINYFLGRTSAMLSQLWWLIELWTDNANKYYVRIINANFEKKYKQEGLRFNDLTKESIQWKQDLKKNMK